MSDKTDEWDTHSVNPYVSEYVRPLSGRESGWEYVWRDVCNETFALMLWKLQEDYHMDYETAFLLAGHWRVLSPGRLTHMFGKDGIELSDNQPALRRSHPEMRDTENKLPKRNIIVPRASQDIDWMEGSIYD